MFVKHAPEEALLKRCKRLTTTTPPRFPPTNTFPRPSGLLPSTKTPSWDVIDTCKKAVIPGVYSKDSSRLHFFSDPLQQGWPWVAVPIRPGAGSRAIRGILCVDRYDARKLDVGVFLLGLRLALQTPDASVRRTYFLFRAPSLYLVEEFYIDVSVHTTTFVQTLCLRQTVLGDLHDICCPSRLNFRQSLMPSREWVARKRTRRVLGLSNLFPPVLLDEASPRLCRSSLPSTQVRGSLGRRGNGHVASRKGHRLLPGNIRVGLGPRSRPRGQGFRASEAPLHSVGGGKFTPGNGDNHGADRRR